MPENVLDKSFLNVEEGIFNIQICQIVVNIYLKAQPDFHAQKHKE